MVNEIKLRVWDKKRKAMWFWEDEDERKIILNWISQKSFHGGDEGKVLILELGLIKKIKVKII